MPVVVLVIHGGHRAPLVVAVGAVVLVGVFLQPAVPVLVLVLAMPLVVVPAPLILVLVSAVSAVLVVTLVGLVGHTGDEVPLLLFLPGSHDRQAVAVALPLAARSQR
jgi:hypothetical protein